MSESFTWMQGIREQAQSDRDEETNLNVRLDKIITELEAADCIWWTNYYEGMRVANTISSPQYKGDEEQRDLDIQKVKRMIVRTCVIPAMHACVRAGYLKPPPPWEGK